MNYKHKLVELAKEIINNSSLPKPGFPVAALFYDANTKTIVKKINLTGDKKHTDYKKHAEFQCLQTKLLKKGIEYYLIVSIPPCTDCLEELLNSGITIKKILYITERVKSNLKPKYLKKLSDAKIKHDFIYSINLPLEYRIFHQLIEYTFNQAMTTRQNRGWNKEENKVYISRLEAQILEIDKTIVSLNKKIINNSLKGVKYGDIVSADKYLVEKIGLNFNIE